MAEEKGSGFGKLVFGVVAGNGYNTDGMTFEQAYKIFEKLGGEDNWKAKELKMKADEEASAKEIANRDNEKAEIKKDYQKDYDDILEHIVGEGWNEKNIKDYLKEKGYSRDEIIETTNDLKDAGRLRGKKQQTSKEKESERKFAKEFDSKPLIEDYNGYQIKKHDDWGIYYSMNEKGDGFYGAATIEDLKEKLDKYAPKPVYKEGAKAQASQSNKYEGEQFYNSAMLREQLNRDGYKDISVQTDRSNPVSKVIMKDKKTGEVIEGEWNRTDKSFKLTNSGSEGNERYNAEMEAREQRKNAPKKELSKEDEAKKIARKMHLSGDDPKGIMIALQNDLGRKDISKPVLNQYARAYYGLSQSEFEKISDYLGLK